MISENNIEVKEPENIEKTGRHKKECDCKKCKSKRKRKNRNKFLIIPI